MLRARVLRQGDWKFGISLGQMQSSEVFPFLWPFLVPWFPPALVRGRLLSQTSSNYFFPFHIIKYKQMTEEVVGGKRGSAVSEL